jgi:1-phosphatidylinositol-4-phosphate 5-kinase
LTYFLSILREEHLPNGDIYVGKFHGPIPHGFGKYAWVDGVLYEGEWDQSKITGKGRIVWHSGSIYEGEVCGGFLEGSGILKGVDGSFYNGSWHMSKFDGMGMKTYPNADIYEGFWKEGLQVFEQTYMLTACMFSGLTSEFSGARVLVVSERL